MAANSLQSQPGSDLQPVDFELTNWEASSWRQDLHNPQNLTPSPKPAPLPLQATLPLIHGLGFQLPMRAHLAVQAVVLACSLATNGRRCAEECLHPYVARFYERLADGGGELAARSMPLSVPSRRDMRLPPAGACALVLGWTQVIVGCVLPTLVIDWSETSVLGATMGGVGISWLPGSRPKHQALAWAILHFGLLAVASTVCLKTAELMLGLLYRWGPRR